MGSPWNEIGKKSGPKHYYIAKKIIKIGYIPDDVLTIMHTALGKPKNSETCYRCSFIMISKIFNFRFSHHIFSGLQNKNFYVGYFITKML